MLHIGTRTSIRLAHCMALIAVVALVAAAPASALAWEKAYDPSLGTLPAAQGWQELFSPSSTGIVSGGLFHQGPTGDLGYDFYYSDSVVNDFTSALPFTLEARVDMTSSGYVDNSGVWISGFLAIASDNAAHAYVLGITDTGVRLGVDTNVSDTQSTAFIPYNTYAVFHTYKIEAANGSALLSIDGAPVATLAMGSAGAWAANRVLFGDATTLTGSETYVEFVRYGNEKSGILPEPGSLLALVTGISALAGWRRRG